MDEFAKVYIINMKKDTIRREKAQYQLDHILKLSESSGTAVEIFEGVSPVNNPEYDNWAGFHGISQQMTYETFDHKTYQTNYPDLQSLGSKDELWNHYSRYGKSEGRSPYRTLLTAGAWGCLMSHRNILRDAQERNYKRILILEDDFILIRNFYEKLEQYIDILRTPWKLLYFGGTQLNWNGIIPCNIYFASGTCGSFAIAVDSCIYHELTELYSKADRPVDLCLQKIQQKYSTGAIVFYPNLVIADLDNSNIRSRTVNYNQLRWDLDQYHYGDLHGFVPEFYRENYQDLQDMNDSRLLAHWMNYGQKEHRIGSPFTLYCRTKENVFFLETNRILLNSLTISPRGDIMFNIITRTSRRHELFSKCYSSIQTQTYRNYKLWITYDTPDTYEYVSPLEFAAKLVNMINFDPATLMKKRGKRPSKGAGSGTEIQFKANLYLNKVMSSINKGVILILDDDDYFITDRALEVIAHYLPFDGLFLWSYLRPDKKIFPKNPIKPELGEIATCSIAFYYDKKRDAACKVLGSYYGDYEFLKKLFLQGRRTKQFMAKILTAKKPKTKISEQ